MMLYVAFESSTAFSFVCDETLLRIIRFSRIFVHLNNLGGFDFERGFLK